MPLPIQMIIRGNTLGGVYIETKRCARCKEEKPVCEFNKKRKKKPQPFCRICQSEYLKEWYQKNKERHIQNVTENKKKSREWFRQFKKTLSCEECGEDRACCLDFHHKDTEEKEGNVSILAGQGYSVSRIMKEIEKCSVLCANCHRYLHWLESQENEHSE